MCLFYDRGGDLSEKFCALQIQEKFKCLSQVFPVFFVDAVFNVWGCDISLDDICFFQFFQMLGYCRLRQGNFLYDVAADTMVFIQQQPDDGDARRMREGLAELCNLDMFVGITILVTHHA